MSHSLSMSLRIMGFRECKPILQSTIAEIPYIASFDRDFDTIDWLQQLAKPEDLAF
ncbi:MAG: hypothetical protein JXC32_01770 [Anaerolineae bacterium]|nr:hypothetical protein [Anaerolineae bacterium]